MRFSRAIRLAGWFQRPFKTPFEGHKKTARRFHLAGSGLRQSIAARIAVYSPRASLWACSNISNLRIRRRQRRITTACFWEIFPPASNCSVSPNFCFTKRSTGVPLTSDRAFLSSFLICFMCPFFSCLARRFHLAGSVYPRPDRREADSPLPSFSLGADDGKFPRTNSPLLPLCH